MGKDVRSDREEYGDIRGSEGHSLNMNEIAKYHRFIVSN